MKFSCTSAKAASKTVTISWSTALITRCSSRRELFTSSSCCTRKSCRSCSASYSSSASGLIGPMSRRSRSRSRARPASVVPSGTSGAGASSATPGSQSKSVRMRSTAASSRMRFSASSTSRRCWRSRTPASSCSCSWRWLRSVSSRPPASLARSAWMRRSSRSRPSTTSIRPGQLVEPAADRDVRLGPWPTATPGSARPPPSPPDHGRGASPPRRAGAVSMRAALVDRRDPDRVLAPDPAHLHLTRVEVGEQRPRGPRSGARPRPRPRRAPAHALRARRCGPARRRAPRPARSANRR